MTVSSFVQPRQSLIHVAMAAIRVVEQKSALIFAVFLALAFCSEGRLVGGKKEIKEVKSNTEVQELGRFCVEEYNEILKRSNNGGEVKFTEVVEAREQVVAGIKYYLKISARRNGAEKMFDSVVVVKPWIHSKQLVNFSPSFTSEIS